MENVNSNWENALEYNPESFGRVVMLYIDSKVPCPRSPGAPRRPRRAPPTGGR